VSRGRSGPQGHRQGCRCLFARAGALSKSPAAAHGLAGHSPASAEEGRLLFGYFLLATQEKVTRAPMAHESCCIRNAQKWVGLLLQRRRVRTFAISQ
jgi:hypothetical protein